MADRRRDAPGPVTALILLGTVSVIMWVVAAGLLPTLAGPPVSLNPDGGWYKLDEASVGTNLLTNGGFETYTTSPGAPDGWTFDDGGTSAQLSQETVKVQAGASAVKVTSQAGATFPGLRQDLTGLTGGSTYCLKVYARTDAVNVPFALAVKLTDQTSSTTIFDTAMNAGQYYAPLVRSFVPVTGHTMRLLLYENTNGGTAGMVGYWDSASVILPSATVLDSSANGQNGTPCGPTAGAPGITPGSGSAYLFEPQKNDGFGMHIEAPSSAKVNGPTITMSGWVNLATAKGTTNPRIFDKIPTNAPSSGYFFYVTDEGSVTNGVPTPRQLSCEFRNPTNAGNPQGDVARWARPFTYGVNYFVTCVNDGSTISLYVNATLVATAGTTAAVVGNTAPLEIGNRLNVASGTYDRTWNGTLDDLRIWSYPLTAQDVFDLYNGRTPTRQADVTLLH